MNIIVKDKQSGLNLPVIHVPMSHKSEFLYLKIFETIEKISHDFNIKLNMHKKTCITDFEKGLRKILRNLFDGINLRGCYFHYVKALWSKAKKLGLCVFKKIQITKLIIFGLKVLTLQSRKCQEEMIKEISLFVDGLEDNTIFKKFISYYQKNWFNNKFIRFDICYDKIIKIRTDNVCEGFHRLLNHRIEFQKPKNALICDILKQFAIEGFRSCVQSLVKPNKEEKSDISIFAQCYDYLVTFHNKYHKELNFEDIKKLSKDPKGNIDKITISMLSLYKDSYIKYINKESTQNLDNEIIEDKFDEEENLNSEEENINEIIEKINNLILSEEKEIESYDEDCEEDILKTKKKKRNYNEIKNEIMDSLINFNNNENIKKLFKQK